MNKIAAELSRLIMSFEIYLGRMRLIGLGFAHAYTQNRFDQLQFLSRISDITAQAMRDSAISLEDIGDWPKFQLKNEFAIVPSFLEKPIAEARRIAEDAKMELEISQPIFRENTAPETVIAQEPAPGLYVGKETAIKVTPATNRRPNVDVPDFGGATILEAFNLAQNKGLQIKAFALDFDAGTEEGQVIAQDLRVGLNVVQGTPISLTIAKKTEPTLTDDGS